MEPETPTKPIRLRKFAIFFKGYMGVSSMVIAALPIPVSAFRLLPILGVHRKVFSVYTPLFCFLVLAFIFYNRHALAKYMFPSHTKHSKRVNYYGKMFRLKCTLIEFAPGIFIVLTLLSIVGYHVAIDRMVYVGRMMRADGGWEMPETAGDPNSAHDFTKWAIENAIPESNQSMALVGFYVSIFIFAEAAFILMALKEYMQDVLGISDREMLGIEKRGHKPPEETKS